jgi:hypothetical protein
MAHTRHTLALDERWDLHLNEAGNIATTSGALATAQGVANECRLFTRDAYFEYDKGLPHKLIELGGKNPPRPLLRTMMRRAAFRVPDVAELLGIELEDFDRERRLLTGNISFKTVEGERVELAL